MPFRKFRTGRVRNVALHHNCPRIHAALFDEHETTLFSVHDASGTLLAGEPRLPLPPRPFPPGHRFRDLHLDGQRFRLVVLTLDRPSPVAVSVAQSTSERAELLRELLGFSLGPQLLLLGVLAWRLRRAVTAEIARVLKITPRTVAFHKYSMMEQLGVKSSAELVQFAVKQHIVTI